MITCQIIFYKKKTLLDATQEKKIRTHINIFYLKANNAKNSDNNAFNV